MITAQIRAFAELGKLFKETQLNFAESSTITDPEVLRDVQALLEEEIGDLDQVTDLTIDDSDTFRGKAEQRLSLGKSQLYQFALSPSGMSYKMLNAADMAEFADREDGWTEIIEFAATKGKGSRTGKKLNCKPGNMQCGGKCQRGDMKCSKTSTPEQKAKVEQVAAKAKTKTKGSASKAEKKTQPKVDSATQANEVASQKKPKATTTNQAKQSANQEPLSNEANTLNREEAKKNKWKILGEGIQGEVYLDPTTGRAVKFSNHTIEEKDIAGMKSAADLGLSPKIYSVSDDRKTLVMEALTGYKDGIHPESLGGLNVARTKKDRDAEAKQIAEYDRMLLSSVKKAHDNGYVVADLKEDNVMLNEQTKSMKFVDQAGFSKKSKAERALQILDLYDTDRPLAAERAKAVIESQGSAADKREYKQIQKRMLNRDTTPISDEDLINMAKRVYELAGVK